VFLLVAAASGWSDLGLGPPLAQQLAGRFAAPLPIQVAAVPLLLEGRDAVVHAETGSGKTLSWALALQGRGAVVVAPSETLCQQLRRECAAIGMAVGDASAVCDVVFGGKELFAVATPYDAMRALDFADLDGDGGPVAEVGRLCLVLDEADALLKTLGKYAAPSAKVERQAVQDEPAAKLIRRILRLRPTAQLVAASATVGRPLKRELESFLKTSTYAREPLAIARVAPRGDAVEASLEQKSKRFVTAPQGVRHLLASIADAPRDDMRRPSEAALDGLRRAVTLFGPAARILVVVADPTASPERVQKALRAAGYNAVALREYTREASDETRVIVARASSIRGIDLAAIDYVVSLGRPSSSDEYLHICGRTARAGRNGTALTLATDHDMGIVKSWQSQLDLKFQVVDL